MLRILLFFLSLVALAGGIAGGLALAWGPFASGPGDYSPAALRPAAKDEYIEMVASAYVVEQDVREARERIELLEEVNARLRVTERARAAANDGDGRRAYRLANLALALGVEEAQIIELARPALLESARWRWVAQSLYRCDALPNGDRLPFVRLRAEDASGMPLADVTATLDRYDGSEATLRTDSAGVAQAPFAGEGMLTFSDGMAIPLHVPNLQAECTTDNPASPHAVEVIVRAN